MFKLILVIFSIFLSACGTTYTRSAKIETYTPIDILGPTTYKTETTPSFKLGVFQTSKRNVSFLADREDDPSTANVDYIFPTQDYLAQFNLQARIKNDSNNMILSFNSKFGLLPYPHVLLELGKSDKFSSIGVGLYIGAAKTKYSVFGTEEYESCYMCNGYTLEEDVNEKKIDNTIALAGMGFYYNIHFNQINIVNNISIDHVASREFRANHRDTEMDIRLPALAKIGTGIVYSFSHFEIELLASIYNTSITELDGPKSDNLSKYSFALTYNVY